MPEQSKAERNPFSHPESAVEEMAERVEALRNKVTMYWAEADECDRMLNAAVASAKRCERMAKQYEDILAARHYRDLHTAADTTAVE